MHKTTQKRMIEILRHFEQDPTSKALSRELLLLTIEETLLNELKHGRLEKAREELKATGEIEQTMEALSQLVQLATKEVTND